MATPTSIVLITTLLAVTAACARPVSSQSLRAGRGTVLPAGSAADIVRQCSRGTPGPVDGVWTPTSADIVALDRALAPVLVDALKHSSIPDSLRPPISRYYRQYAGLVVGGKRIIYVNGFDDDILHAYTDSTEWHRTPIVVCDGGEGFFGAEYDPSSLQVRHFQFNGNA